MVSTETISELFDTHFEWLAVRETGRDLTLRRDEIDVVSSGKSVAVGFITDQGYSIQRVSTIETDGSEFVLCLARAKGRGRESIRFVPREPAAELAGNIEFARLRRANAIANAMRPAFPNTRPERVELSPENGRLAYILFSSGKHVQAVIADVTESVSAETLLVAAMDRLEKLAGRQRRPVKELGLAARGRQCRDLRRLHGLLNAGMRNRLQLFEIEENGDELSAKPLRPFLPSDLWREKAKKLSLPERVETSRTAGELLGLAPDRIDIVRSRNGETLRFCGMPFVRVRKVFGRERAWFGLGRDRTLLTDQSREHFHDLLETLIRTRDPRSEERYSDIYRLAPEAWLESILRRNIKLLDANLILSPIYSQFRTSADKIDLLALRRDGRLVIIEIKTSPEREMVFQAADYWRKIELHRRRGLLDEARLFGGLRIADKPAMIYAVAPALAFHRDLDRYAASLIPEIEIWRWELDRDWRHRIRVIARRGRRNV